MKYTLFVLVCLFTFSSCKDTSTNAMASKEKKETLTYLPFTPMDWENTQDFAEIPTNWQNVGSVYVDKNQEKSLVTTAGKGVLANIPNEDNKAHLFTAFDHGDIEVSVEVMMPKGSNSGIYFQGRYEVQLLDSWGVTVPQHSDMGGIYHRWDDARGVGNEGYEGAAPKINAAKAPGLWQQLRVIFHAPKFDAAGNKVSNALFQEVWLNGVLVQENVEVSGPTRAAAFEDEKPMGPLMIQGDHGGVALRNMNYKKYSSETIQLSQLQLREYPSDSAVIGDLNANSPLVEIAVDSMASTMVSANRAPRILRFTGKMKVPKTGDYLFDIKVHDGGSLLIVANDTVVNLNGDFTLDSLGIGVKTLEAGEVPFELVYNKHRFWREGFSLAAEGPGIQKHALTAPSSLRVGKPNPEDLILLEPKPDEVALQRSFWMHDGAKRTHCIAVGTPKGVHYAYDLATASILQVWDGAFFDATEMWLQRGEKQLGQPLGFSISFGADTQFVSSATASDNTQFTAVANEDLRSTGYTLDAASLPVFGYKINDAVFTDTFKPAINNRGLVRTVTVNSKTRIAHKVAEGEEIKQLPDGTYIINNESYFISFEALGDIKPEVRNTNGKEELIVQVPQGEHSLSYTIIW